MLGKGHYLANPPPRALVADLIEPAQMTGQKARKVEEWEQCDDDDDDDQPQALKAPRP